MLFILYQIIVIRELGKNCMRQKFYDYRTFTIRNFILFAICYLILFAIRYLVFRAQIIPIANIQKLHHFLENFRILYYFLTLFLSVLKQYFIFNQYQKLQKSKYRYIFIAMYVYIVLDKKLIDLFGKTKLPIICAILKI